MNKDEKLGTMWPEQPRVLIDTVSIDFDRQTVSGPKSSLHVEPKVLAVLRHFIDFPGEVVSRESLIDAVWGVQFGGNERLARAISLLRKALLDAGLTDDVIETVPKRGYRLLVAPRLPDPPQEESVRLVSAQPHLDALPSIAVLPLAAQIDNPELVPFAQGFSEELTNRLTHVPGLMVAGRIASIAAQDWSHRSAAEIGAVLKADCVLTGSLTVQSGQVRVAVELICVANGDVVLSISDERSLAGAQDLIEPVARAVVRQILGGLDEPVDIGPERKAAEPEAYVWFTLGRSLAHHQYGQTTIPTAIGYLTRALELDPSFTEALGWRALARFTLPEFSLAPDWCEQRALAKIDADQALSQDPDCAIALVARGLIHACDMDFDAALKSMERATTVDPANVDCLAGHGLILMATGYAALARPYLQELVARDPLSGAWHITLSGLDLMEGHVEAARRRYLVAFNLGFGAGAYGVARCLSLQGRHKEAVEFMMRNRSALGPVEQAMLRGPLARWVSFNGTFGYSWLARRAMVAAPSIGRLMGVTQPTSALSVSLLLSGQIGAFIEQIRSAPPAYLPYVMSHGWNLDNEGRLLRADPAFAARVRDMNLPAIWDRLGRPPITQTVAI